MSSSYSTEISPNDHMWKTGQPRYFDVGLSALDNIMRALASANVAPRSILDLPCGHGRVCRMLRMAFPDAHLTVSDLDPDGVEFCARHFHAEPLYSHEDIRRVKTGRSFDLVWCGSLFTHLDRDRWPAFLEFFSEHLSPGGVLIFTTHGRRPIQRMAAGSSEYGLTAEEQHRLVDAYVRDGFGFVSPPQQAFGISLSSTSFVCTQVSRVQGLALIGLHEAGWAEHQDVVACIKLRHPYGEASPSTFSGDAVRRTPRAEPSLDRPIGHIDDPLGDVTVSGELHVSGWAGDHSGIREIRALLDGHVVAVGSPHIRRPDVSMTYPEFRQELHKHGWQVTIDATPGVHRLTVEATNSRGASTQIGIRNVTVLERAVKRTVAVPNGDPLYERIHGQHWFYEFDLPDGSLTRSYLHANVASIHPTRLEMLWRVLNPVVNGRWSEFTAIDIGCHQGYFSSHLARRGCRDVLAIDARAEHVENARLIAEVFGLKNMRVNQHDVSHVSAETLGTFDIAVVFGLLYHLENPVGLLRLARQLTRNICLIETQIGPDIQGTVAWGSQRTQWPIVGAFSIVDESDIMSEPESNLTPISLFPSLDGLRWLMRTVGFRRVEVVPPTPDAHEMLASGARVMMAGFV